MSEKPHTLAPALPAGPVIRKLLQNWGRRSLLTLPFWTGLALVFLASRSGDGWLDRLAVQDAALAPRPRIGSLWVLRSFLTPGVEGRDRLWQAGGFGAESGFFLAGALRAEQAARPGSARLWLSLEAQGRGRPEEVRAWLAQASPIHNDVKLPSADDLKGPKWLARQDLARPLYDSISGERSR